MDKISYLNIFQSQICYRHGDRRLTRHKDNPVQRIRYFVFVRNLRLVRSDISCIIRTYLGKCFSEILRRVKPLQFVRIQPFSVRKHILLDFVGRKRFTKSDRTADIFNVYLRAQLIFYYPKICRGQFFCHNGKHRGIKLTRQKRFDRGIIELFDIFRIYCPCIRRFFKQRKKFVRRICRKQIDNFFF